MSKSAQAARNIKRWREHPVAFAHEVFGFEPDAWQREVLESFADPTKPRISMQACAGPGKTAIEVICGWNFLMCYGDKGEHPKGAAVSITADNLADNLWPEFAKWQSRSEMLMRAFKWTKSRIFSVDHPETWFFSARSFSKTADTEEQGRTLSGIHSEFVLFLIDESGDIPLPVLKAAEQAMGKGRFAKILQAGNPTSLEGMLYAAATKLRHLWHIIRITGDPDDPNRSPRIDIDWAKEQISTYGRSDPWVMSMILGLFPPSSANVLLGPDEVAAALGRQITRDKYDFAQKRLGVDVARFGSDRTVIFPRQGLAAMKPAIMRNARSNEIAARVALAKSRWQSEVDIVDGTGGWGSGVIDALIQAGHGPVEYQGAGQPSDMRYANKRAEVWFAMAEWIKRGGCLPNIPDLQKELTAPTYTFRNGKFLLEPKEMIKKRLGFSPDLADALSMTFALPEMPGSHSLEGMLMQKSGKVQTEYDPFDPSRT